MIRGFATLCLVPLIGLVTYAVAGSSMAQAGSRALPMHFELRQEGPASACGTGCRQWIAASGMITGDTPRDFKAFASGRDLRGNTIVLESDGGSVLGALALGREIRRLGLATTVGRSVNIPGEENGRARLDPHADCESMCAFVLLAGVHRHVPAEARVLVHQIWLGDRRDDPTAASYSAEDLVLVQRDIGSIAQYVADMGISAEILDLALRIPPWEPMRQLKADELKRLQFITVENPFVVSSSAKPASSAASAAPSVTRGAETRPAGGRGWSLLDGSDGTAITRRHPLTVEGEEIGGFDLTFACGPDSSNYLVSYSEWRHGTSGGALSAVTLTIGQKPLGLSVASSKARDTDQNEVDSFASATIQADVLKTISGANSRSLTIATTGAGRDTSIRLGNTGLLRSFPQLMEACEKKALLAKSDTPQRLRAKTGVMAHAD